MTDDLNATDYPTAGINGDYETEIFYDDGKELVSVMPGINVNDDQADKANACLAEAA